ncbi:tyrosine-type recombinase/integrase [Paraburkholderia sp. LEh10]|uniref:tyrosine-type recombinase/integrase n=1 Tax=Paraburkholderia sp. LEh10 TaxID=2821353 RepID=UPI001AE8B8F9|nr:tyrosine-type recombinase/integrase [Paraburkholderia sp. LEh10]MBP0596409.1 tyrosine-type recombinase/integrase [Paraburkholderia sp. LEh10]
MNGLTPLRPQPQAWLWRSVLSPFAERYCDYLLERGYAPTTVNRYVKCVAHFAHWVAKRRIPAARVDYRLVNSFVSNHLSHCTCPDPIPRSAVDVRAALQHLLVVLGVRAVPWFLRDEPDAIRDEVSRFIQHLEDVCGLADSTRYQRGRIIRDFLRQQFGDKCLDIAKLQIRDVYRFVTQYPDSCGAGVAKASSVALRSYLRFRMTQYDDCVEALIAAVPNVARWRLAALPETLSDEEIRRILNSFDRETASGLRDYAMVRCLVDLGLRAGEVVQIQLDDLNWRDGTLRIRRTKSRRMYVMPLPEATGRAIADYIRLARKATAVSRSVFVALLKMQWVTAVSGHAS